MTNSSFISEGISEMVSHPNEPEMIPFKISKNFDFAISIAKEFHRISRIIPKYGCFWVSAAGGTANVVAGEIAIAAQIPYDEAHFCLDRAAELMGIDDWYGDLYYLHGNGDFDAEYRYDARDVAKWAIRSCRKGEYHV